MGSDLSLSDAVVSANTGLDAIKRAPIVEEETGIKCLRIQDVNQRKSFSDWGNTKVEDKNFEKFQLQENDILIARTGGSIGVSRFISEQLPAVYNNGLIRIRVDTDNHCPKFIFYLLQSKAFESHIQSIAYGTSAQPNMKIRDFLRFKFKKLGLSSEQKISEFISALDNKITLNRQINQTLEQMAQTLFKSWFVDFDPVIDNALDAGNAIPDELQARAEQRQALRNVVNKANAANQPHSTNPAAGDGLATPYQPLPDDIRQLFPNEFEESELGWVPKGWRVSTAGDELTIKGGSTPSTKNPEFWEAGDIHWTSPKDLSGKQDKIMLDTERKITKAGLEKITSGLLPPETVLMSSRAPVGYLALTKIPLAINQGYIAIPESKSLTQEYILYWLDSQVEMIKSISGGTTFAEISKKTFRTIPLIVPPTSAVSTFSKMTSLYLNKITQNIEESSSLCSIRDSLLPKLISGELEIE